MGPTWGPPGSCWPQVGLMLAPSTLLSGMFWIAFLTFCVLITIIRYFTMKQAIKIKTPFAAWETLSSGAGMLFIPCQVIIYSSANLLLLQCKFSQITDIPPEKVQCHSVSGKTSISFLPNTLCEILYYICFKPKFKLSFAVKVKFVKSQECQYIFVQGYGSLCIEQTWH